MRAVRFDHYGAVEVLQVCEVPIPEPGPGQLLVAVRAAAINPGEAKIRNGALHAMFPASFPSGQGSDLSGVVEAVGPEVTAFKPGDEVVGFTDHRASHAQYVIVEQEHAVSLPPTVPHEVAGALYVAGTTAYAMVRAVDAGPGDTVLIGGATGGVGVFAVQIARARGATVIGVAGPRGHGWLRAHGATAVAYGDGLPDRVREAALQTPSRRVDAVLDIVGGYVELGLALGVSAARIDTLMGFLLDELPEGLKQDGNAAAGNAATLKLLLEMIQASQLAVPVARTFPLEHVREAYTTLDEERPLGKIVLLP